MDLNGVFKGKYLLEWNEHAKSSDLVFWEKVATKDEMSAELSNQMWNPTYGIHREINSPIVWRHNHPLACDPKKGPCFIVGYIDDFKTQNEEIWAKVRIEGWSDAHRLFQHMIVNPLTYGFKGIGWSIHTRTYKIPGTDLKRQHFEELSLTPWPRCEKCLSEPNIDMAKIIEHQIGVKHMAEKTEEKPIENKEQVLIQTIREMQKTITDITGKQNEAVDVSKKALDIIKKLEGTISAQKEKLDLLTKKPLIDRITSDEKEKESLYAWKVVDLELFASKMESKDTKAEADDAMKVKVESIKETAEEATKVKDPLKNLMDKFPTVFKDIVAESAKRNLNLKSILSE